MSHVPDVSHSYGIELGDRGRLVLPAVVRRQLGLSEGDKLVLTVEPDGSLKLRSMRDEADRLFGLFRDVAPGRSLADELIAERRAEAARE